jgi:hypothetical protein
MAGDRAATLMALQRARQIAPEQTHYHPMVRETARVLISFHRRSNRDLTQQSPNPSKKREISGWLRMFMLAEALL